MVPPMLRTQDLHHGDLIATLEFRTAQAVLPSFQRQLPAFHFLKSHLAKEIRDVCKREYRVERKLSRLGYQTLHHPPSDSVGLPRRVDRQRAHLTHNRAVEMQRSAADQVAPGVDHREIADVLRHLKFG